MKKIMFNDKYGLTAAVLIDKISGKGTWERNQYVLAYAMYYAAQNMSTDASRLHKAMEDYHQFIIQNNL